MLGWGGMGGARIKVSRFSMIFGAPGLPLGQGECPRSEARRVRPHSKSKIPGESFTRRIGARCLEVVRSVFDDAAAPHSADLPPADTPASFGFDGFGRATSTKPACGAVP